MVYELCSAGTLGGMAELNSGFCLFYTNLYKPLKVQQLRDFFFFQLKNLDKQLERLFWAVWVVGFYFPTLENTTMPELAVG